VYWKKEKQNRDALAGEYKKKEKRKFVLSVLSFSVLLFLFFSEKIQLFTDVTDLGATQG
jgi:hypothetical protein